MFLRRARDYAFKMKELTFEHVVVHRLDPRGWQCGPTRLRQQSDAA
jgi:hypothetical protein